MSEDAPVNTVVSTQLQLPKYYNSFVTDRHVFDIKPPQIPDSFTCFGYHYKVSFSFHF